MRRMLNAKSSSLGRPLRRERVSLVIARSVSGREREREERERERERRVCKIYSQHSAMR